MLEDDFLMFLLKAFLDRLKLQQFSCWQVFGWTVSSLVVGRGWRRNPVAPGQSFYDYHCLHLTIISQQSGIK